MPDNLKVLFLGDGDTNKSSAFNVFAHASQWKPDFVVYNADFDYRDCNKPGVIGYPEEWMRNFESYFGDTPLFATIGNHDSMLWFERNNCGLGKAWETVFKERYDRLRQTEFCSGGNIGIDNACYYKGFYMLEAGIGEISGQDDSEQLKFISDALSAHPNAPWKLCSWHKNQRLLQLCTKSDSIGYKAYEECRKYGAIINNAHEHSYSRTHTMRELSSSSRLIPDNKENDVTLDLGKTFVFVQGLAGASVRNECNGLGDLDYWAAWAAGNGHQNAQTNGGRDPKGTTYGSLFCTFKPNGIADRADCFFEDITGTKFDEFSIYTKISSGSTMQPTPPPTAPPPTVGRGCRREYDTPSSGYSPQRYALCGGSCCRAKAGDNACYYTVPEDQAFMCDTLPDTCTYRPYSEGGFTGDNSECLSEAPDPTGCRRAYDKPENGYEPQRLAKCGDSCCRSKPGDNACYYTAGDVDECKSIPASCEFPRYEDGGFTGDNSRCVSSED